MGLDLNGFVEVFSDPVWEPGFNLSLYFGRGDYRVLYDLVDQIEEAQGYPRLFPSNEHNVPNIDKCGHALDESHTFTEKEEVSQFIDLYLEGWGMTVISPTWLSYAEFSRISLAFEKEYMRFCTFLADTYAARYGADKVRLVFWLQ